MYSHIHNTCHRVLTMSPLSLPSGDGIARMYEGKIHLGVPFCEDQWTTVHPSVIASIHRIAVVASALFHIQQA